MELHCEGKEKGSAMARVNLVSLSSQPVDTDEPGDRIKPFLPDNLGKYMTPLQLNLFLQFLYGMFHVYFISYIQFLNIY